ncbi:MAG TPA: hypothetical protein VEJ20_09755 [Candidatus Eremiobacteraceae bacterium]|nr:hypothetical protein [Candidatus Eremiobacteraceae bacterium]
MSAPRAIRICALLERRSEAHERCARDIARRCVALEADAMRAAAAARFELQTMERWDLVACSSAHLRQRRCDSTVHRLRARTAACERDAQRHGAVRRHWAQVRRALERRIARRLQAEAPWPA